MHPKFSDVFSVPKWWLHTMSPWSIALVACLVPTLRPCEGRVSAVEKLPGAVFAVPCIANKNHGYQTTKGHLFFPNECTTPRHTPPHTRAMALYGVITLHKYRVTLLCASSIIVQEPTPSGKRELCVFSSEQPSVGSILLGLGCLGTVAFYLSALATQRP